MNGAPTNAEWSVAFAKQARADFDSWNGLSMADPAQPSSQKLHFLQMACEKLGKAHVYKSGQIPADVQSSHTYIAKHIPQIVRQVFIELGQHTPGQQDFVISHSRRIAREIELLHPSVTDGGKRLDNCEYPWLDQKGLHVPCESSFLPSRLITEPNGRNFLKVIDFAIDRLIR